MTGDAILAVQVRLNTAAMALKSALAEAVQPVKERDELLLEQLFDALDHIEHALELCNVRLRALPNHKETAA